MAPQTRRAIFGIAALACMPLRSQAAPADLASRYEALIDAYNSLPVDTPDDVDRELYDEFMRLDDDIAQRPCLTREDARAKIAHGIRGLLDGDRGTEVSSLRQVMTYLEAI